MELPKLGSWPMATAISGSEYGATAARDVPEGLPKFSPNANALLEAARAEASRRGHSIAGTEHVLWALLQPGCTARVLGWIESNVAPQEDGLPWRSVVLSRLEANPVFRPTVEASEACQARTFSPNILEAVAGAAAAPSPPVMLSQSLRELHGSDGLEMRVLRCRRKWEQRAGDKVGNPDQPGKVVRWQR